MAQFVGPLPTDPVLGGDARTRAHQRLMLQQRLQEGYAGQPPMTADDATALLNEGEHLGRVVAVQRAMNRLTSKGASRDEASALIRRVTGIVNDGAVDVGYLATGAEEYARHAPPADLDRRVQTERLGKLAGLVSRVGDLTQLGIATGDLVEGGDHKFEEFGGAAGGLLAGSGATWGTALALGSLTGPWTTAALVVAASYLAGEAGDAVGSAVGRSFDG